MISLLSIKTFQKNLIFVINLLIQIQPEGMSCKIVQGYVITPIELGKGCFGTVYRGYVKDNKSELLAVKTIPLQSIKNEEVVRREIEILLKLKSPNIVKFYKPAKTAKHLYFFLEYCQQDLKTYVKSKGGRLSESQVQNILMQICNGLKVVHQNNVIHRDIKPANFLIHNGVVKLSDFGFARVVDDLEQPLFLTFLGSPLYMAPQILAREKFSSKCDVWSLGVTIYEILYGKTPYTASNPKELLQNIRTKPLLFPENIPRSQQIKDLLRLMLKIEQEKRISMVDLINHEYVRPSAQEVAPIVVSEDTLVQSFASNQSYMSKNKVVTKTSVNPQISNNLQGPKEKLPEKGKQSDFNIELTEQNEQINVYLKIEEVDEAMRYKRNVSVFLNVQCNNFFTNASENLSELQFHIGLFILLFHQIKIHSEIKEELNTKKSPSKRFLPEIWEAYLNSIPYQRINKLIDSDLKHLESYYKEVKNRVELGLKNQQNKAKYADLIKIFQTYYNDAKENRYNEEAYEAIVKIIISQLKKTEKKIKDNRLFSKLIITIRPFRYLKETLDFGLFYERQEEEMEKLRKEFNQLIV